MGNQSEPEHKQPPPNPKAKAALKETSLDFLLQNGMAVGPFIGGQFSQAYGLPLAPAASFDLPGLSPVKDQNPLGTCTSFAVCACVERVHPGRILSEADLTVYTERTTGDCLAGLATGPAVLTATMRGMVEDKYWPYPYYIKQVVTLNGGQLPQVSTQTNVCAAPPSQMEALPKFRLTGSHTLHHTQQSLIQQHVQALSAVPTPAPPCPDIVVAIKGVLCSKQWPVIVEVPVFDGSGWDTWGQDAIIRVPSDLARAAWLQLQMADKATGATVRGWHAVVVTGYHQNFVRFKNSWGEAWGNKGYGWFAEEYLCRFCRLAIAAY